MTKLLRVQEVADQLQLSTRTVHRLAELGELPRIRILRSVRFDQRDVDAFVERRRKIGC